VTNTVSAIQPVPVPLGCVRAAATSWSGLGPQGWLALHPQVGVVMPQTRIDGGWRCEVIAASPHSGDRDWRVWLTDEQLDALPTTVLVRDGDVEGFALLWQVRVRQRFTAGPVVTVARLLAEHAQQAGDRWTLWNPVRLHQLCVGAHVRADGLRMVLARLVDAGMLRVEVSTVDTVMVGLVLTVEWAGLPQPRPTFVAADGEGR
jgi:hypothetical protein